MYVLITNTDGSVSVANPSAEILQQMSLQEYVRNYVPDGVSFRIVTTDELPVDRRFRGAWVSQKGNVIEDLAVAKDLVHTQRRSKRAEEFAPLDVEATIPMFATQAEKKREAIRGKYAELQQSIEAVASISALREIAEVLDA